MTAVDPAALRELAQGLTVPTIAEAPMGCALEDALTQPWLRVTAGDVWALVNDEDEAVPSDTFGTDARITHVPLSVEQLAAVREALEGAAAEMDVAGALREAFADLLRGVHGGEPPAVSTPEQATAYAMTALLARRTELDQARAERDAANAQCAAVVRERNEAQADVTALYAVVEWARDALKRRDVGEARTVLATAVRGPVAVLARTDPLRAEPEGGEDRG